MARLIPAAVIIAAATAWPTAVHAAITTYTLGDTHYETLHPSNEMSLQQFFVTYADPFARPDGTPLDLIADQSQIQQFSVMDQPVTLAMTLLGGFAGYKNILGVYSYDMNLDPAAAPLTMTPLVTGNVTPPGSTVTFTIAAGRNFGFYLDANGGANSRGIYYSENSRNTDGSHWNAATDHFLMFNTNHGLAISAEDLSYQHGAGLLGDQDYQDMIGLLTRVDGLPIDLDVAIPEAIPEPATLLILTAAGLMVMAIDRRHPRLSLP